MIAALLILGSLFTWDAVPGAASYRVCWSHDASYWNAGQCANTGLSTAFDDSEFVSMWGLRGRQHIFVFFQVAAVDSSGDVGMIGDPTTDEIATFDAPPSGWVLP